MVITFGKHFFYKRKRNPRKLNNIPTYLLHAKVPKIYPKFPEDGWNLEMAINFGKHFCYKRKHFSNPCKINIPKINFLQKSQKINPKFPEDGWNTFFYKRKHFSNHHKRNNIPKNLFFAKITINNLKLPKNDWNWEMAINFGKQFLYERKHFLIPVS